MKEKKIIRKTSKAGFSNWFKKHRFLLGLIGLIALFSVTYYIRFVGYPVYETGNLVYRNLEGGVFNFETHDHHFCLGNIKSKLSDSQYQMVMNHPDTKYPARLFGIVLSHMSSFGVGGPVEVITIELL